MCTSEQTGQIRQTWTGFSFFLCLLKQKKTDERVPLLLRSYPKRECVWQRFISVFSCQRWHCVNPSKKAKPRSSTVCVGACLYREKTRSCFFCPTYSLMKIICHPLLAFSIWTTGAAIAVVFDDPLNDWLMMSNTKSVSTSPQPDPRHSTIIANFFFFSLLVCRPFFFFCLKVFPFSCSFSLDGASDGSGRCGAIVWTAASHTHTKQHCIRWRLCGQSRIIVKRTSL